MMAFITSRRPLRDLPQPARGSAHEDAPRPHDRAAHDRARDRKSLSGEPHHKQECRLVAHRSLGRYLTQTPSGRLVIDRTKIKAEERLDGEYLLTCSKRPISR